MNYISIDGIDLYLLLETRINGHWVGVRGAYLTQKQALKELENCMLLDEGYNPEGKAEDKSCYQILMIKLKK